MTQFAPVANLHIHKGLSQIGVLGDYHLLLAHQILDEPEGYAAFWSKWIDSTQRSTLDITIDNSVIELGEALDFAKVIEAADLVGATTVVLPDVIDDAQATLDLSELAYEAHIEDLEERGLTALGIAQGTTFDEVVECAGELVRMGARRLGIPRGLTVGPIGSRVELTKKIWRTYQLPIHLFGFSDNLIDDIASSRIPGVIGIDSAMPIWHGLQSKTLPESPPAKAAYGGRPDDYDSLESELNYAIKENLERVRSWLSAI